MEKTKRSERLVAMMRLLSDHPNQVIPYSVFCEMFGTAKSSVSEDVALMEKALKSNAMGDIHTVTGAAGGVCYRPIIMQNQALALIENVCESLNKPDRVLPGGYLYLSDLLSQPDLTQQMGAILAGPCYSLDIDFVLTMETKGIPVAMMTAFKLNVPLIIARRSSKVYEGSAVNISFPDGKGGIETMSLARRAIKEGQRALIVDDFMRHGATALGMITLMKEFNVTVAGLAFMLAKENPQPLTNLPEWPLMTFTGDGVSLPIKVRPAAWLTQKAAQG